MLIWQKSVCLIRHKMETQNVFSRALKGSNEGIENKFDGLQ